MNALTQNILVLVLAVALDVLLPDPPNRIHPVAWMGRAINALRRLAPTKPTPALLFGAVLALGVVGASAVVAHLVVEVLHDIGEVAHVLGGALILRYTFAVRGLSRAARRVRNSLELGRLDEARADLRSLVSRNPSSLGPSLIAAAAIGSVAENTTDSFVGPWLAFSIFGVPGAVAYRAVNTLDSMLGYRGAYEYLGKASARLDDLVNLIPARLSALLLLSSGFLEGLPVGRGWRLVRTDRRLTPSPNAGWTMSAMAGLVGVKLEKPDHYCLGRDLDPPLARHIDRAVRLAERTAALAFFSALGLLALRLAAGG
ncbi:MAG: adenosylcobinamide-phosphate synthase CbiB [bacterium]|nr:adenosylcobinamide-phosphate synthase CbiB [bacterium]MDE0602220.1 adenosylcobinamide-phosphate synthase CbiB [bacterium]